MRSLPEAVLAKLDAGLIVTRGLMRFDFGGGTYAFWTGTQPLTYEGLTYLPGSIIEVEAVHGSWGMDAEGMKITLAAAPDDGLTPDVLATIEQEDYHQRPVTISDLYIDPDTRQILFREPVYRGYVDVIEHDDGPEPKLIASCESRALDNQREGYRMRSTADQALIHDGDLFFQHAEVAGKQELWWGRKKP
ncbi:DUF2163 domain-containing protein [Consotaella salsifontis]|uniref:Uncharacterized conserved protein n=1 Tax=Consotaella salsifontis TaxID=1365950 RepID=A0A1T4SSY5_9HYPH|nr:DUF2163 domain-containing protein [Consotaella salsifontis]SKA30988.1 Uncharacterized conserved protein [Consotaella salsifontis]